MFSAKVFRRYLLLLLVEIAIGFAGFGIMWATGCAWATMEKFLYLYIFVAAAVIIFIVVNSSIIDVRFYSKLNKNLKILTADMKVQEYITTMKELVKKTKTNGYRSLALLNLAVGYSHLGEYGKAVAELKKIDPGHLETKMYRAIYYNNFVEFLLCSSDFNRAEELFVNSKKYFEKYSSDSAISSSMISTLAHREFVKGNLAGSEELFLKARNSEQPNVSSLNYIDLYLAFIYLQTNRAEKAAVIVNYIQEFNMYPSVRNMVETLKIYLAQSPGGYSSEDKTDDIVVEVTNEE